MAHDVPIGMDTGENDNMAENHGPAAPETIASETWRITFSDGDITEENQLKIIKETYQRLAKVDETTVLYVGQATLQVALPLEVFPEKPEEYKDCFEPTPVEIKGKRKIRVEFVKKSQLRLSSYKTNRNFMAWLREQSFWLEELFYNSPRYFDMAVVLPMAPTKATDRDRLREQTQIFLWQAATESEKAKLCPTIRKGSNQIELTIEVRKIPKTHQASVTRDCIAIMTPREMAREVAAIMEREDETRGENNYEAFQCATSGFQLLKRMEATHYNLLTKAMEHTDGLYETVQVSGYAPETLEVDLNMGLGMNVAETLHHTPGVTRVTTRTRAYTDNKLTIHCLSSERLNVELVVDDINQQLRTMRAQELLQANQFVPNQDFIRILPWQPPSETRKRLQIERLQAKGITVDEPAPDAMVQTPPRAAQNQWQNPTHDDRGGRGRGRGSTRVERSYAAMANPYIKHTNNNTTTITQTQPETPETAITAAPMISTLATTNDITAFADQLANQFAGRMERAFQDFDLRNNARDEQIRAEIRTMQNNQNTFQQNQTQALADAAAREARTKEQNERNHAQNVRINAEVARQVEGLERFVKGLQQQLEERPTTESPARKKPATIGSPPPGSRNIFRPRHTATTQNGRESSNFYEALSEDDNDANVEADGELVASENPNQTAEATNDLDLKGTDSWGDEEEYTEKSDQNTSSPQKQQRSPVGKDSRAGKPQL